MTIFLILTCVTYWVKKGEKLKVEGPGQVSLHKAVWTLDGCGGSEKWVLALLVKKHIVTEHRSHKAKEDGPILHKFIKHCYIRSIPILIHVDGSCILHLIRKVYCESEITF